MFVRKSNINDLDRICEIYEGARIFMRENGNPTQWKTNPSREKAESDINEGVSFVVINKGEICGVFAFILGEDPTYKVIDGAWLNDEPYGVIHRLASDFRYKGVLEAAIKFALENTCNLRVDTHENNKPMNHSLIKLGFKRCGEIYIKDDFSDHSKRIAYQLVTCNRKDECGGCAYQGIPYIYQIEHKEREIKVEIEKRKINVLNYESIQGCNNILNYRNKMEYTFGNIERDAPLGLGLHKKKQFMSIVTTDKCMIVPEDFNIILNSTLDFCNDKGYIFYHKKYHTGLLRNLVLRRGVRTNEILVNIVTSSDDFDEDAFKNLILNLKLDNSVCGILHTINDNISDTVTPEKVNILYGRDYYMEEVCNLKFKVSAFSFFQTNVESIERLYMDAVSLLSNIEGKIIFDLYSGTGTISQILSPHAKEVYGVEINSDAVNSAIENAKLNNLNNCHFICGDCFDVLNKIDIKPDVLVVDPPRTGIMANALEKIVSYGCKEILYISCNPKTLCDNLMYFEYMGYKVKYLRPYDNFPYTKHCECVTLLIKTCRK